MIPPGAPRLLAEDVFFSPDVVLGQAVLACLPRVPAEALAGQLDAMRVVHEAEWRRRKLGVTCRGAVGPRVLTGSSDCGRGSTLSRQR